MNITELNSLNLEYLSIEDINSLIVEIQNKEEVL